MASIRKVVSCVPYIIRRQLKVQKIEGMTRTNQLLHQYRRHFWVNHYLSQTEKNQTHPQEPVLYLSDTCVKVSPFWNVSLKFYSIWLFCWVLYLEISLQKGRI